MARPTQKIYADANAPLPTEYVVPPNLDMDFASVRAKVNGSGAGASFIVVLELLTQDGHIMAQSRIDQVLLAGDTVSATWAPFLRRLIDRKRGTPVVGANDNPGGTNLANNVDTAVPFTNAPFDTGGMWNAGQPTRITCVEAGFYYVTINSFWTANAVGYRRIRMRLNGGPTILAGDSRMTVTTAGVQVDQVAAKSAWSANVGDYLEITAIQNSGGNLTGFFAITAFKQSEQF